MWKSILIPRFTLRESIKYLDVSFFFFFFRGFGKALHSGSSGLNNILKVKLWRRRESYPCHLVLTWIESLPQRLQNLDTSLNREVCWNRLSAFELNERESDIKLICRIAVIFQFTFLMPKECPFFHRSDFGKQALVNGHLVSIQHHLVYFVIESFHHTRLRNPILLSHFLQCTYHNCHRLVVWL